MLLVVICIVVDLFVPFLLAVVESHVAFRVPCREVPLYIQI